VTTASRARTLVTAGLLLTSGPTRALDPGIALRLESASPESPAATPRLDMNGTNQTSALLPEHPTLLWQTRVAPPLVGELAADANGRLLVAHGSDRVTAFDAKGHSVWSLRVGTELVLGPLPVGRGRSLVVTRDARVVRVSTQGTIEGRDSLPWAMLEQPPIVTSTRDGGAIIAAGSSFARLGPLGAAGYEARLPDPIRAVFERQGGTLAVGYAGGVFIRKASGDPVQSGSFGEPVRAVALVGQRLYGVGRHELVTLDLVSKERRVVFADSGAELRDLAALGGGRLRLLATRAVLIDLDPSGHEQSRQSLPVAESGGELGSIVTDRTGRTLLGATGSTLIHITPQGDSTTLPDTSCLDPMRPTPVADGRFVVACRSGLLRAFSDKAR
jgi:hypothetical protein